MWVITGFSHNVRPMYPKRWRAVSKSEAVMSLCEKTGSGHSVCVLINLFPGGRNWSEMMRFKRVNGCAALRLSSVEWASRVRGWASGCHHSNQITSPAPSHSVSQSWQAKPGNIKQREHGVPRHLHIRQRWMVENLCVSIYHATWQKKFLLHGTEPVLWYRQHLPVILLDPKACFVGIAPVCAFFTTVSLSQHEYIGSALFFPRDSLGVQVCARSAVCAQGSWWHPSPRGNQPTLPAVAARLPTPPPVTRFGNIWWFTCITHHLPDALQAMAQVAPLQFAPQKHDDTEITRNRSIDWSFGPLLSVFAAASLWTS